MTGQPRRAGQASGGRRSAGSRAPRRHRVAGEGHSLPASRPEIDPSGIPLGVSSDLSILTVPPSGRHRWRLSWRRDGEKSKRGRRGGHDAKRELRNAAAGRNPKFGNAAGLNLVTRGTGLAFNHRANGNSSKCAAVGPSAPTLSSKRCAKTGAPTRRHPPLRITRGRSSRAQAGASGALGEEAPGDRARSRGRTGPAARGQIGRGKSAARHHHEERHLGLKPLVGRTTRHGWTRERQLTRHSISAKWRHGKPGFSFPPFAFRVMTPSAFPIRSCSPY